MPILQKAMDSAEDAMTECDALASCRFFLWDGTRAELCSCKASTATSVIFEVAVSKAEGFDAQQLLSAAKNYVSPEEVPGASLYVTPNAFLGTARDFLHRVDLQVNEQGICEPEDVIGKPLRNILTVESAIQACLLNDECKGFTLSTVAGLDGMEVNSVPHSGFFFGKVKEVEQTKAVEGGESFKLHRQVDNGPIDA
uniref:Uncharacterized protein n=1 Tax=Chromera velia CCMP2878 TaxID=1169474 RepID=A0A0G4HIF6_9ALVE|eukprot:Cvel_27827.t1-p1 / transcript=Cvel_27827.t1 / gene=Cvel_27827 / organism=Chromera_velia_CCMP2878 / gene_product=hypothetical protein / transcript_product=hypothetical protein / location=Cvel_scaffold3536:6950-7830(-) / protein_length=196 / sequence_SO=supercontig / SO=protein_coding / is_pseudo=false